MNGSNDRPQNNRRYGFSDINLLSWKWIQMMRGMHVQFPGPMAKATVLKFVKLIGKQGLTAADRWLETFKIAHNI